MAHTLKLLPLAAVVLLVAACGGDKAADMPSEQPAAPTTNVADPSEPTEGEPIEGEGLDLPTWDGTASATFTCTSAEAGGVVYTISMPQADDSDLVSIMESFRQAVDGAEKPAYLLVEVDATKARPAESHGAYMVQWATVEQTTGQATSAMDSVTKWMDLVPEDDSDLYNKGVETHNAVINTEPATGAKGQILFTSETPITSMVAPIVMPDIATMIPCDLV